MNPIQLVMRGAADWGSMRRGVTFLFRGVLLFALGMPLAAYVFHVYSNTNLFGGSPPGSAVLGFLAVIGGLITLVGGPLLILGGAFLLASIPAESRRGRWAAWGVVCIPALLLMMTFLGWAIHQLSIPRAPVVHEPVQPPLPPNASQWDSIVGPPNAQALPAPPTPPLVKPRQVWGIDVDVILGYAAFLAVASGLFGWSLCITHILRVAARSWGDSALSRWFSIFFIVAWCTITVGGLFIGKWGYFDWEPALLQRITDACLPELTGEQILYSATVVLLGLMSWQMVLLGKLLRDLKWPQSDPALRCSPA